MKKLDITIIPVLDDNYVYLLRVPETDTVGVIDPAEAGPVLSILNKQKWKLQFILNTHHHHDHIGGNMELKRKTGAAVIGNYQDAARIPGIDLKYGDGDIFRFGSQRVEMIATPGHTHGGVCYYFKDAGVVFVGDTLFAMGCGRLFEGTPQEMYQSLQRLALLLKETKIYSAHEYAHGNARFALTIEPNNKALNKRFEQIVEKLEQAVPEQGYTVEQELETNPFLRVNAPTIRKELGMERATPEEVLAELRWRKDSF